MSVAALRAGEIGRASPLGRLSTFLYLRPRLVLLLLLVPPLLWLGVIYLGSLLALLAHSFFRLDDYTAQIVYEPTISTYAELFSSQANLLIILRSVLMATAVTVISAIIGFPLAYYMARFTTTRTKAFFYIAVMLPLWSNYLVRVYSWKVILAKEGVITWFFNLVGAGPLLDGVLHLPVIGGPSLSVSSIGTFLAFLYVWLPYMILPTAAALERVPHSLVEASGDLGARPWQTFRHVLLPLAFPGVVAGSIFTFSLTLGDFVIPGALGNSSLFLGQAVLAHQGTAGNIPMAAAFTVVPMAIMAVYLTVAKKCGAFDAL